MKLKEIWKGVFYQGIDLTWRFECSNKGRIWNTFNKHIYIPHKAGSGYYQICTTINGESKNVKVHKAIAESFIPNPDHLPAINHIDGNKENNCVENLEWCTYRENSIHAYKIGLMPPFILNGKNIFCTSDGDPVFIGEKNGMSKLTSDDVKYIRDNYIPRHKNQKCNRNELAEKFHVSPQLIYKIYKKSIWQHI